MFFGLFCNSFFAHNYLVLWNAGSSHFFVALRTTVLQQEYRSIRFLISMELQKKINDITQCIFKILPLYFKTFRENFIFNNVCEIRWNLKFSKKFETDKRNSSVQSPFRYGLRSKLCVMKVTATLGFDASVYWLRKGFSFAHNTSKSDNEAYGLSPWHNLT